MKKIVYSTLAISAVLTGLVALTPSTTASAKTKLYTNSKTLRNHKYWYSYQNAYTGTGKWGYKRLHFSKHSVHFATKTKRNGKWKHAKIAAKYYYVRHHNGWYEFGARESDDVYLIKPSWRYLNGHKHWTLGEFDPSNDHGGYGQAPYNVWTYTTYMNNKGWHYTINHQPS